MKSDYNHGYLSYDTISNYIGLFHFTINKSSINDDIEIELGTNCVFRFGNSHTKIVQIRLKLFQQTSSQRIPDLISSVPVAVYIKIFGQFLTYLNEIKWTSFPDNNVVCSKVDTISSVFLLALL